MHPLLAPPSFPSGLQPQRLAAPAPGRPPYPRGEDRHHWDPTATRSEAPKSDGQERRPGARRSATSSPGSWKNTLTSRGRLPSGYSLGRPEPRLPGSADGRHDPADRPPDATSILEVRLS